MNLVSIRLITDDIRHLVGFYERVLGASAVWSNDDFAEFRTASGTLAIGSTRTVALFGEGAARPADNHTAIIEFIVEDVDSLFDGLESWVTAVVARPTDMPWGNRSLLVRDPDGNLINLFTPVTERAIEKFAAIPR